MLTGVSMINRVSSTANARVRSSQTLQQGFCYWIVLGVWCIFGVMVVMAVRADQFLVCGVLSGGHSDDKGRRARCGEAGDSVA